MCLAVPMKVVRIDGPLAVVRCEGVELTASLDLVEDVGVGDYVIVHAGYAIQTLTSAEAGESLALLERLREAIEAPDAY